MLANGVKLAKEKDAADALICAGVQHMVEISKTGALSKVSTVAVKKDKKKA